MAPLGKCSEGEQKPTRDARSEAEVRSRTEIRVHDASRPDGGLTPYTQWTGLSVAGDTAAEFAWHHPKVGSSGRRLSDWAAS